MSDYDAIIDRLRIRKGELEDRLNRVENSLRKTYAKDWQEQSIERENDEVVQALDESIRNELVLVNTALARVDKDDYGICAICGDPIPVARLEALPYTDRCVSCASESE
ncbi:MAG: TraR/DksA family transcriptional regulator [Thermodesulfobacteriota bacterium]